MRLTKKGILIISVILILIISVIVIKNRIAYPLVHVEYNGKITNVKFDIKRYGYFKINNSTEWFQMHYLNCDLQIGDSMYKKMDDNYIFHYRDKKLIGKYSVCFGYRYK